MGASTETEDLRASSRATSPHRRARRRPRSASSRSWRASPPPCDEHADPTHVTASGIVVGRRGTVLHLHKRLGIWMQPGGHIDPGETPDVAARREATEELGLDVTHPAAGPRLIHLDVHEAALGHTHLDLRYLLLGADDDPAPAARREPRRPLVHLGRGHGHGRRRAGRRIAAGPRRRRGRSRDRRPRPPARGAGPRHLHHPAAAPSRRPARDVGARRGRGPAGRAGGRAGRRRRTARPRWPPRRRISRSRSPASPSGAAPWSSACTPPPARRAATCRP